MTEGSAYLMATKKLREKRDEGDWGSNNPFESMVPMI
jgi:hypothetical protein